MGHCENGEWVLVNFTEDILHFPFYLQHMHWRSSLMIHINSLVQSRSAWVTARMHGASSGPPSTSDTSVR